MSQTKKTTRRRLNGVVVSDKMDKTVVVRVDRTVVHPKYHKRLTRSTRFKAHDAENKAKQGDKVTIEEIRPMSKGKCWRVVDTQTEKS